MLWIISGPSSVGKSSFISSPRCAELTQLPPGTPVLFPHTAAPLDQDYAPNFFLHYNILRPANMKPQWDAAGRVQEPGINTSTVYNQDPEWNLVSRHAMAMRAIVLAATPTTILNRVRERQIFERLAQQGHKTLYPAELWLNVYGQVDLVSIYREWCRELEDHGIPYLFVDSTDDSYPVLSNDECFRLLQPA